MCWSGLRLGLALSVLAVAGCDCAGEVEDKKVGGGRDAASTVDGAVDAGVGAEDGSAVDTGVGAEDGSAVDGAVAEDGGETQPPLPAEQAMLQLVAASAQPPQLHFEGSTPSFALVDVAIPEGLPDDLVAQALDFLVTYKDLYGLTDVPRQLFPNRVRDDASRPGSSSDLRHVFFSQRHHGVPVYGAELAVHLSPTAVRVTSGRYLAKVPHLSQPLLGRGQAEAVALALVPGTMLEVIGATELMLFNPGLATGQPPSDEETRLAWRVSLRGYRDSDGAGTALLTFVDANNGALLSVQDRLFTGKDFAIRTVYNTYSDTCWQEAGEESSLWFDEGGPSGYPGAGADDALDGHHAYDAAHLIYDAYFGGHERDGWDSAGGLQEILVHAGTGWENASFSPTCDHIKFGDGMAVLDVIGHEWGHAVDWHSGEVVYYGQRGALAESFADFSATLVDPDDWTIGEDTVIGALRSLSDPGAYGDPSHLDSYRDITADNGGVHTNAGIPNKAFYLTMEGGTFSGYQIPGMGRAKTNQLYYLTLVDWLGSSANFDDARNVLFAVANILRERGDLVAEDVCTVRNAWAAVGVAENEADPDCDGDADPLGPDQDRDGVGDAQDNCPAIWNPGQGDLDHDSWGDACDSNIDGDDLPNATDPCPWNSHFSVPADCIDTDGDDRPDASDNCPNLSNWLQEDIDGDQRGDACDDDRDGDGVDNGEDNCPDLTNPLQADQDRDGVGDICDNCEELANASQADCNHNGVGAACDASDFIHAGGGCSPPYFEQESVFVHPGSPVELGACSGCAAWLPQDFRMQISITTPASSAARIVDSRGQLVARGQMASSQLLSFYPSASFHYQASGIAEAAFQGERYFLVMPSSPLGAGDYQAQISVEHSGR